MDLIRERMLMADRKGSDNVKEWKILYDSTLTEDLDSIIIPDFDGTEVEVYIAFYNKNSQNDNLFLTTNKKGGIYETPRVACSCGGANATCRLSLKKITNMIWETGLIISSYFQNNNPTNDSKGFFCDSKVIKSNFDGLTLSFQNGSKLLTGNYVYIRGR